MHADGDVWEAFHKARKILGRLEIGIYTDAGDHPTLHRFLDTTIDPTGKAITIRINYQELTHLFFPFFLRLPVGIHLQKFFTFFRPAYSSGPQSRT